MGVRPDRVRRRRRQHAPCNRTRAYAARNGCTRARSDTRTRTHTHTHTYAYAYAHAHTYTDSHPDPRTQCDQHVGGP